MSRSGWSSVYSSTIPSARSVSSTLLGLALNGVERKQPLVEILSLAVAAVGRLARAIIRLTPFGIFAIAANTAGTLRIDQVQRVEVDLVAYHRIRALLGAVDAPRAHLGLYTNRCQGESLGVP